MEMIAAARMQIERVIEEILDHAGRRSTDAVELTGLARTMILELEDLDETEATEEGRVAVFAPAGLPQDARHSRVHPPDGAATRRGERGAGAHRCKR